MTADAPTWGEIVEFLRIDGWREIPPGARGGWQSDHVFFEKLLPDGRLLRTHVSHSTHKRPSPGRFGAILCDQLEVSRREFWQALRSREAVDRPVPAVEGPVAREHDAWVVDVLANQLHLTAKEIEALSEDKARERVLEFWSRPRDSSG